PPRAPASSSARSSSPSTKTPAPSPRSSSSPPPPTLCPFSACPPHLSPSPARSAICAHTPTSLSPALPSSTSSLAPSTPSGSPPRSAVCSLPPTSSSAPPAPSSSGSSPTPSSSSSAPSTPSDSRAPPKSPPTSSSPAPLPIFPYAALNLASGVLKHPSCPSSRPFSLDPCPTPYSPPNPVTSSAPPPNPPRQRTICPPCTLHYPRISLPSLTTNQRQMIAASGPTDDILQATAAKAPPTTPFGPPLLLRPPINSGGRQTTPKHALPTPSAPSTLLPQSSPPFPCPTAVPSIKTPADSSFVDEKYHKAMAEALDAFNDEQERLYSLRRPALPDKLDPSHRP
ncbi:hypothetical protein PTTG_30352, partial [Puccinia triticina 1-1 BBBD Race 1]